MAQDEYSAAVLAHFRAPHHAGSFEPGTVGVTTTRVGTQAQGEVLELQLKVHAGQVREARFRAYGGPALIALGSLATQRLEGCPVEQARAWTADEFLRALALEPRHLHSALLLVEGLQTALDAALSPRGAGAETG